MKKGRLKMEPYTCSLENASKIRSWLQSRGGIAIWKSINLSNLGVSWTTPADNKDKPNWQAESVPSRIITDEREVMVSIDKEVKRFHVAIRPGSQGFSMKCTAASSAKIRSHVDKAGEGAYYVFDYSSQEAVILAPDKTIPLTEEVIGGR